MVSISRGQLVWSSNKILDVFNDFDAYYNVEMYYILETSFHES